MRPDERIDAWAAARRAAPADVPPGFAGRVMTAALRARSARGVRIAVLTLAALAGAARIAATLALFAAQ